MESAAPTWVKERSNGKCQYHDQRNKMKTKTKVTERHKKINPRTGLDRNSSRSFERTNLIIDGIPFRYQHPIYTSPLFTSSRWGRRRGEVSQSPVKLGQLVDGFVPNKSFANKYDFVRGIY
jgi:hypothetical protein